MRISCIHLAGMAFSAAVASLPLNAADPAPPIEKPAEKATGREAELETRVKTLEKRVQELEEQLEARNTPQDPRGQQWFQGRPNRFNRQPPQAGRDMDEMWERFRRELEQEFGGNGGFNMPANPWGRMSPDMMAGPKPRLGVELAPISDELAQRYKNTVKEGAFVMSVVPNSPAEKAGLNVGDAITSFDGKPVRSPQEAIAAVRSAPKGKHTLIVSRRGEQMHMDVDLGAEAAADDAAAAEDLGAGWLRRNDDRRAPGAVSQSKTEVKAEALELTDELAKSLKLTDDQRQKMGDILSKHNKLLTDEFATSAETRSRRGGYSISITGNIGVMVDRHATAAEKELKGVLNDEQLKQWAEHRKTHNNVSMSHSSMSKSGDATPQPEKDDGLGF